VQVAAMALLAPTQATKPIQSRAFWRHAGVADDTGIVATP